MFRKFLCHRTFGHLHSWNNIWMRFWRFCFTKKFRCYLNISFIIILQRDSTIWFRILIFNNYSTCYLSDRDCNRRLCWSACITTHYQYTSCQCYYDEYNKNCYYQRNNEPLARNKALRWLDFHSTGATNTNAWITIPSKSTTFSSFTLLKILFLLIFVLIYTAETKIIANRSFYTLTAKFWLTASKVWLLGLRAIEITLLA